MRNPAVVLIPTYNERENIRECLNAVLALEGLDVAIIDDDSEDQTAEEVRRFVEEHSRDASLSQRVNLILRTPVPDKWPPWTGPPEDQRFYVILNLKGPGFASSYLDGFRWAIAQGYSSIVTMDADLSHPTERIPALLQKLAEGADGAVGSRYVPGGRVVGWGPIRRFISRFGNFFARLKTRSGILDMTSGFMAWKSTALASIIDQPVSVEGYSFLILVKVRAKRAGFRVTEVPITFTDRQQGRSKFGWKHISEAVRALMSDQF
jgi:dolichol-phosphate mannosyltransferase